MARVRITRAAQKDLDEIWYYIAQDSPDNATRFVDFLTSKFSPLADSPKIGRLREDLQPGLRFFPVKSYIIYYRALGKSGVSILRVVNAARDQGALFRKS